jgi:hypothetical protein
MVLLLINPDQFVETILFAPIVQLVAQISQIQVLQKLTTLSVA